MTPEQIDERHLELLISYGWSKEEAKQRVEDIRIHREAMKGKEKGEPREITSSTYKRAQKRLTQDVENWFGDRG